MPNPFFTPSLFIQPSLLSPPKFFSNLAIQQIHVVSRSHWQVPIDKFRLCQGPIERGSLARTETALISPSFQEVWTAIAVLRITDSLQIRLKNFVYCKQWPLIKILTISMAKHLFHYPHTLDLLSFLLYPTNTIRRRHIPLENSCLTKTIFIPNLSIHASLLSHV